VYFHSIGVICCSIENNRPDGRPHRRFFDHNTVVPRALADRTKNGQIMRERLDSVFWREIGVEPAASNVAVRRQSRGRGSMVVSNEPARLALLGFGLEWRTGFPIRHVAASSPSLYARRDRQRHHTGVATPSAGRADDSTTSSPRSPRLL